MVIKMEENNENENWSFFSTGPPDSLRDGGYKNTAYALGELVDNSIEEDARDVDIIMFESFLVSGSQRRWKIEEIGILDNGNGMSPFQLRCSLRYQDGANQRQWSRSKGGGKQMGKFGVGLPQATLSQCRRIDIWSWTPEEGGLKNAHWTYWNLDEPETFRMIPEPVVKKIPDKWKKSSDIFDEDSGTLIVWSDLDKVNWSTSTGLYNNAEFLIGRMYRKMIQSEDVVVRMLAFENKAPYNARYTDRDRDGNIGDDEYHQWILRANDPLYLDPEAQANNPPVSPAFEQAGETQVFTYEVRDPKTGIKSNEEVRFTVSIAKVETREGHGYDGKTGTGGKGGRQPHGKHAKKNMGLSIVRENRELELDDSWALGRGNQAWERWWGAEVSFGKGMDHVFGVTNNKQQATRLNEVRSKSMDYFREYDDETDKQVRDRLKKYSYETWICLDLRDKMKKTIDLVRNQIEETSPKKKAEAKKRHKLAEEIASKKIKERRERGITGASDETRIDNKEDRIIALRKELKEEGVNEALAEFLEDMIGRSEYEMVFAGKRIDGDQFFSPEPKVGSLIVYMNEEHVAFKHLFQVLDDVDTNENLSQEQLKAKVRHATAALKLILGSYAKLEDDSSGQDRRNLQRIRRDWGKYADDFLPDDDDEYED